MTATLAYSSTTGSDEVFIAPELEQAPEVLSWDFGPYCFVCGRCTDHFAEHDDLVESGQAAYGADGTVYSAERTPWHFEGSA